MLGRTPMATPTPLSADRFDALLLGELDAMYRMARRLTRSADRADDLVQEAVARALANREKFQLQSFGIKPWLLRIVYNAHLNRSARDRRQPAATEPDALDAAASTEADALPIDPASWQAMDERVVAALDALPTESRAVLLLWAVEGLSYKEIAATLDVPIGTVMSRLHRARQRAAAHLRPYAAEQRLIP